MRVGGRAEWLVEPARPEEFAAAWRLACELGLSRRVLGGGANLIIEDGLHEGVVFATDRMARLFRPGRDVEGSAFEATGDATGHPGLQARPEAHEGEPLFVAWAGQGMPGLVRAARDLAWTGLEGLVGVPGQVGGGVAMNAGGRWGELWDVVERVHLLTPEGELIERERAACSPGYRDANLDGHVVMGAALRLAHGNRAAIHEEMRQYLSEKSAVQPVTERSCGCIFRNPDPELSDGRSAGQLVDQCGGKGMTEGDAIVSPKHGNFIVNRGRARSADVLRLIERVERLVEDRTGVRLHREAKAWSAGGGPTSQVHPQTDSVHG